MVEAEDDITNDARASMATHTGTMTATMGDTPGTRQGGVKVTKTIDE